MKTITKATFTKTMGRTEVTASVRNTVNGDVVEIPLFGFYDDELSIHPDELVGLTVEGALKLHQQRDVDYLRS